MNDPHVEALIYVIEHDSTVSYEDAKPIEIDRPDFCLKVEDGRARFELKEHYATAGEARDALQPFVDQWAFEETLRTGPGQFALRFDHSEIEDRHPTPGVIAVSAHPVRFNVTVSTPTVTLFGHYPLPPSDAAMDIHNHRVQRMFDQYIAYRNGRDLAIVAYICYEEFEQFRHELKGDADRLQIGNNVLKKVRKIANTKGGQQGRHAIAIGHPLTQYEVRLLEKAVVAMIVRAAKVAADPNQPMEFIDLGNLLEISP